MDNKEAIEILKKGYPDINRYAPSEIEDFDDDVRAYNEAVGYAISHLEEDRWISVTERTPDEDVAVIVSDIETYETYSAYYVGGGYWECDNGTYRHRITHWKPFPKRCDESGETIGEKFLSGLRNKSEATND